MCPLYEGRLWFKCSCGTGKKFPLYGMSTLERFCYKRFLRNSSGTKLFACLRELSALGRFHCKMLSTYVDIFPLRIPWYSIFVYAFTCIYPLLSQDCIVVRKCVKTSFFFFLIVIWTSIRCSAQWHICRWCIWI